MLYFAAHRWTWGLRFWRFSCDSLRFWVFISMFFYGELEDSLTTSSSPIKDKWLYITTSIFFNLATRMNILLFARFLVFTCGSPILVCLSMRIFRRFFHSISLAHTFSALWISSHGFIRCMGYLFLSCTYGSCGSIYGWLFIGFLPYLVCFSEVTDDVHQGIAACTSFFFRGCISLHAALPFIIPFSFVRGASNDFVCDSLPN